MVLHALITQLKTGTIPSVETRGNRVSYPAGTGSVELIKPYVLVYDDFPINSYYLTTNTVQNIAVDVHFPVGFIDELNAYVEEELITLLHKKRLTDNGHTFQIEATMYISQMQEPNDDKSITGGNDDGTISRKRRFIIPRRGS